MSGWQGSDRRSRLPREWPVIRRRILTRDGHRCTERDPYGDRCVEMASEVDHVVPGDDHRPTNLRSLCEWHHARKSGQEGAAARAAQWRLNDRKFRRGEKHPGMS